MGFKTTMRAVADRVYGLTDIKPVRYCAFFLIFIIMALLPMVLNNNSVNVLWTAMSYMLLALGLNIIVGYCAVDVFARKFAQRMENNKNPEVIAKVIATSLIQEIGRAHV